MEKPTPSNLGRKTNSGTNKGQILAFALVLTTIFLILTVGLISISSTEYLSSSSSYKKNQALNLAEAGVDKAIRELNSNSNYTGTGENAIGLGNGEFEVSVSGEGGTRTIESIGYIPNKAAFRQKKTVRVTVYVSSSTIAFHYAVQVGLGGVELRSNSEVNGNVYSNAGINGSSNTKINGDAFAVGTISSPNPRVSGLKRENQPPSDMPVIDYDYWKTEATKGGIHEGDWQIGPGYTDLGPIKVNGKLVLDTNSIITLKGPVYATAGFEMKSNSNLYLDAGFGSRGTMIITDGKILLRSNAFIYPTESTPKGYVLLVTTGNADDAIELNSNTANGLCYALDGGITVNSNSKAISVVTYKLTLESNASLDYDLGLANAEFSSGPGGGWTIQKGTWQEF